MFDVISLIAGAVMAAALTVLVFTQRERLLSLRTSAAQGVVSARRRLSRGVDARYREAVIKLANGWHLAGHLVPLERIAVLPRLYTLPPPHDPLETDEAATGYDGPLNILPLTPDWPQAIGAYQMPGVLLERLLRTGDDVALLGLPGSGRSVTLALIALLVARQTEATQKGGLLREQRLPLLIHLADLELTPEALGKGVDPLVPLLSAARSQLGIFAAQALRAIRSQFAAGKGLILADAWDELPLHRRLQTAEWLRLLKATYPGNQYVVSGSPVGYRPLLEIGLKPAFLMPWGSAEYQELGRLWAAAWPEIGGTQKEPAPEPDAETVRLAIRGNRARTPLDATLKMWAIFAQDDPGTGPIGWYQSYLKRVSPAPELHGALKRMAEIWLSRADDIGLSLEEVNAQIDAARAALPQRVPISTPDFLFMVTAQTHLLAERPGRRITFWHPVIGAYLAAESLKSAGFRDELLDGRQASNLTLPFLAQLTDMTPYVQARLSEGTTATRDEILTMALWAADADPQAAWRADVFRVLTQAFLAPAEFPLVRERTMAALVASRDRNVGFIFRQGVQHEDANIRILSLLGLGALGEPEMLVHIGEALSDPQPWVEAAAALALGALGTRAALNYMLQTLLTGRELARRAVGEMLATNTAGEGHDILREAMQEQDPATRRAAIYGLQLIEADWVTDLLVDAQSHDDQWVVRTAATNALEARKHPPEGLPDLPRLPEDTDWLVVWLAERDQAVQSGPRAVSQMIRALQEGDESTRLAAAETLGALSLPEAITPLYAALRDPSAMVRDSAYRALGRISTAVGHPVPSVT